MLPLPPGTRGPPRPPRQPPPPGPPATQWSFASLLHGDGARGEEMGWRGRRGEWGGREEGEEAEIDGIDGRRLQFNERGEEREEGGGDKIEML